MKRSVSMTDADNMMTEQECLVQQKYSDFESMCKDKNDAATNALKEAEYWTRQRTKLQRPIVLLERDITSIR